MIPSDPKCPPDQFKSCQKSGLCHLCDGKRLYCPPKYLKKVEAERRRKEIGRQRKKKEGMNFEKKVVYRIKTYPRPSGANDIHRQPNSGALWHSPGDIVTPEFLIECKERGTTLRGEKSYTITREQLEKTAGEAISAGRPDWGLVFGFRGDTCFYIIRDFDAELQLVQTNQDLRSEIKMLKEELDGKTIK